MKKKISMLIALTLILMTATTAFAGGEGIVPYSIFGDDNRTAVSSTSGSNLSICKIKITFDDNSIGYGTGFLISSTKVVTAGHNLHAYTSKGAKNATKLDFYFGCSGTNANHTYSASRSVTVSSKNTYYPDAWESWDVDLDYGVVKLSTAYESPSAYFALSTISSPDDKSISIIGYEHHSLNTAFSNWQLLKGTGKVVDSNTWRLFTRADAMPGQSGSPVLYGSSVVGIYTYGANDGDMLPDDSTDNNRITRMTSSVISDIKNF